MTFEELVDKSLPAINQRLHKCSSLGAYCMGAACAYAWSRRLELPPSVLDAAAEITSATAVYDFISTIDKLLEGAKP